MAEIYGILPMDSNESEGLEQWCNLADRPDIDNRCPRSQADFGFPAPGPDVVHVARVQHTMFTSGDMDENSVGCHM